jgi:hypothetical protein
MLLADFNSVLQISVGIHLAYTFLPDLHEFYVRRLDDYVNSAAKVAYHPPNNADGGLLKIHCDNLRYLITNRRHVVAKRIFWMQVLSTLIASLAIILLVIAAVYPKLMLSAFVIACLLVVTLLPMPVFCLYSYASYRAWLQRIGGYRKKVEQEWTRLMLPIIEKIQRLSK